VRRHLGLLSATFALRILLPDRAGGSIGPFSHGKAAREAQRPHVEAGPRPVEEVVGYAARIADALDRAHTAGIVHRALKPDNVIVQPDGRIKLLDFGLAKLRADGIAYASADDSKSPTEAHHLTREGMILGTAAYMSCTWPSACPASNAGPASVWRPSSRYTWR
jgi:serine/threonine protein kinase